jgi:hypothetical protein
MRALRLSAWKREDHSRQITLSSAIQGATPVSGQFGFDFTTDTVTSYQFTAPGDSFDSTVFNDAFVAPFTSAGASYLDIAFFSSASSGLDLVVNPTITEFFTQSFVVGGVGFFCRSARFREPGPSFVNRLQDSRTGFTDREQDHE